AHLDSYAGELQEGSVVRAGQEIGRMGSTGYSTVEGTKGNFATHLHVGIYVPVDGQEDRSINPYYILKYLEKKHTMFGSYEWETLPQKEH
ncbi:MAG: peptidoglycan DD-metalloendopeptidase family protein, partial [Lachnospiraceae bacterium]|nr:peptidoglycan DD-metalloendopeptidase family protein [Lachnospiraceae bacterium]